MSEPKWEDVEVGDAVIAERKEVSDLTISGTVTYNDGLWIEFVGFGFDTSNWTLLDIIKPEPQLPTTPGSVVVRDGGSESPVHYMLDLDKRWTPDDLNEYLRADPHRFDWWGWELVYDAGKK